MFQQALHLFTIALALCGPALAQGDATATESATPAIPTHLGILAIPRFVGLDVYGPLELFNIASILTGLKVSLIAETSELVPTHIRGSSVLIPTYRFNDNPDIDVLLIPGGPASRLAINNTAVLDYVRTTYPKLKYILSVCTGAQVLARAGVLDGKNATTNKFSWNEMVASGPTVNWIAQARWMIDGNIWTSSGVTAGMDMVHEFISVAMQNETVADRASNIIEHIVQRNASFDPFAEVWGAKDAPPKGL